MAGAKEASCFLNVMHYPYPALPGLLTEEEQGEIQNLKPQATFKWLVFCENTVKELEWNLNIQLYISWNLMQINLSGY